MALPKIDLEPIKFENYKDKVKINVPTVPKVKIKLENVDLDYDKIDYSKPKEDSFSFHFESGIAAIIEQTLQKNRELFTGAKTEKASGNADKVTKEDYKDTKKEDSKTETKEKPKTEAKPKEETNTEAKPKEETPKKTSNKNNVKGNRLVTDEPVCQGNSYNLTESQLNTLAYMAYREQGSVEGAKIELSLMANLYEKNKGKYSSVYDYVMHSGWFANPTVHSAPSSAYLNAAKDVLSDGNRYLQPNVVEHDCISDLASVKVNGVPISRSDRSAYIPYQTKITNVYGATYTFVGFAPNGGDPFGYIS